MKGGQYKLANEIYTSLNSETPYSTETIFGLALCSRGLNDNQTALKHIENLLEIQPEHSGAYNLRGIIHIERGELQSARYMLMEAIMKSPKSIEAKYNYGRVLFELGEYEHCLLVLENILSHRNVGH